MRNGNDYCFIMMTAQVDNALSWSKIICCSIQGNTSDNLKFATYGLFRLNLKVLFFVIWACIFDVRSHWTCFYG